MENNIDTTKPVDTKPSTREKKTIIQSKPPEEVMNLHSFIKVKGYSISIEHRMQRQTDNDQSEKTVQEWDAIYTATMTRITK
jgi:hypothetical protein